MSDRTPYTYFVLHIPTGLKYYGSKYGKGADPNTFWKSGGYFTSSVKVKNLLNEYGIESFKAEVRKVFESPAQALNYEYRFLKKLVLLTRVSGSMKTLAVKSLEMLDQQVKKH